MTVLVLKNFLYFAQTVGLLANESTSKSLLEPIGEWSNFELSKGGGSTGYCMIPGADAYVVRFSNFRALFALSLDTI